MVLLISQILAPVSLHSLFFLLFAGYICSQVIFYASRFCTLTAVWRSSNIYQKAMKCTTMTVSNFHTSGLYLCVMIHTVADYLFGDVLPFSQKALGSTFFCLLDCIQKVFPSCKQLYVTNHFSWYFVDVMRGKQGRRGSRKNVNLYECFTCSLTNIQLHGAKLTKQARENIWMQLNLNDLVLVTVERRYRA